MRQTEQQKAKLWLKQHAMDVERAKVQAELQGSFESVLNAEQHRSEVLTLSEGL